MCWFHLPLCVIYSYVSSTVNCGKYVYRTLYSVQYMNHKRPRKLGFYDSFYPIHFGAGNLKDILPYSSFWQHSANLEIFYEDYHQREREREREGRDRNYRHCFSTVLEMVIKCLIVYFLFYKRNIFSLQIFFVSAVSSKIQIFEIFLKSTVCLWQP